MTMTCAALALALGRRWWSSTRLLAASHARMPVPRAVQAPVQRSAVQCSLSQNRRIGCRHCAVAASASTVEVAPSWHCYAASKITTGRRPCRKRPSVLQGTPINGRWQRRRILSLPVSHSPAAVGGYILVLPGWAPAPAPALSQTSAPQLVPGSEVPNQQKPPPAVPEGVPVSSSPSVPDLPLPSTLASPYLYSYLLPAIHHSRRLCFRLICSQHHHPLPHPTTTRPLYLLCHDHSTATSTNLSTKPYRVCFVSRHPPTRLNPAPLRIGCLAALRRQPPPTFQPTLHQPAITETQNSTGLRRLEYGAF